jgi:acyl-CoA synthetase (AMP-forming)/AMP-acid ligase II
VQGDEIQVRSASAPPVDASALGDRLTEDGWLRTGDLARIDDDGFVWIDGRVSSMINRGGLKVFPDEVEEHLREYPGVRDAGIVGVADDRLGEVPWAFLVLAPGTDLDADALRELVDTFKSLYRDETGEDFPQEPQAQLEGAIRAVFDSWNGERAVSYRRINRIPDEWGTAVNVQQMVFGNKGDTSGSGVAFSRDEVTGAPEPSGDFLVNAQGEDVVAGIRLTLPIAEMRSSFPAIYDELLAIFGRLERHYRDMLDTEFTIEQDKLWML